MQRAIELIRIGHTQCTFRAENGNRLLAVVTRKSRREARNDRPDDAIALLSQFLKVNDSVPEMYNARGRAYFQEGDLNHAREDFEHLVGIAPQFPGAQVCLDAIQAALASPRK